MFTPPPSPEPSRVLLHEPEFSSASEAEEESSSGTFLTADRRSIRPSSSSVPLASYSEQPSKVEQFSRAEAKQRTARRTKWTILLVPAILIFITASTRYLSHPAALDKLSTDHHDASWHDWSSSLKDWSLHKRHPSPDPDPQQDQSSSPAISFPSPTASTSVVTSATPSGTDRVLPTIPSSPPVLPTPFPRPLTAVNQNFTTLGCQNFFNNMTSSEAFLDCRPFSLLVKSSAEFIDAQNNLTALNTIIWGTCNTDASSDQCTANTGWFADTLKSQCSQDLINMNTLVVETLTELQAYSLMRTAACLPDPSTNTYCYVEAAHNTNPADLYFYQLPFGIKVPATSKPSCSSCTKSVMALYAQSLNVSALAKTYDSAAAVANGACGTGYVQTTTAIGAAEGRGVPMEMLYAAVLGLVSYGAMW
ncbi:unnamed protein product [Somion occarium]|uniref:DUF7729 domain-containing protein n=1 Tax=Somion occarium TaxID=3059160 RepID=A0ABP1CYA9_9APHY